MLRYDDVDDMILYSIAVYVIAHSQNHNFALLYIRAKIRNFEIRNFALLYKRAKIEHFCEWDIFHVEIFYDVTFLSEYQLYDFHPKSVKSSRYYHCYLSLKMYMFIFIQIVFLVAK